MRIREMPDVMQQACDKEAHQATLCKRKIRIILCNRHHHGAPDIVHPQRVAEPCMDSPWIDMAGRPVLLDARELLDFPS